MIEDLEEFDALRQKFLLEGALGYMYELATDETVKTMDDLGAKLDRDFKHAAGDLSRLLREDLKWAGQTTGLLDKPETS